MPREVNKRTVAKKKRTKTIGECTETVHKAPHKATKFPGNMKKKKGGPKGKKEEGWKKKALQKSMSGGSRQKKKKPQRQKKT